MLGVKLTVLGIIVLLVFIFIMRMAVGAMDITDQMRLALLDKGPKWYETAKYIGALLLLLDIIGVLYSVVWLLFFR